LKDLEKPRSRRFEILNNRRWGRSLWRLFLYGIVTFWVALFRSLPRRHAIFVARLMAVLFYLGAAKYRNNTIRHLTMAFGDQKSRDEIRRLARRVFLHFATAGVDAVRIPLYDRPEMDRLVSARNLHFLDQVRSGREGFILLAGHFGNWELMGAWLGRRKINLHVVGAQLPNPWINRLIVTTRNAAGYTNIERGNAGAKVVKALQDGFPVALLIDQDLKGQGVFVDFFGRKAHTLAGPAVLAGKLGVPILPMAMRLKKDFTYELECYPPLYYEDTGNREQDVLSLTQRCTAVYEQIIRENPEQWAWMHRRWRRKPGHSSRQSRRHTPS